MGEISNEPFFVQTAHASTADFLYFSFVTLTTVGYGDQFPVTLGGRVTWVMMLTIGIALFATFSPIAQLDEPRREAVLDAVANVAPVPARERLLRLEASGRDVTGWSE